MFTELALSDPVQSVRDVHAPDALVFECEQDFETVPPTQAENLALVVDEIHPKRYDPAWIPTDAPEALHQYVSEEFAIGLPGDGGVTWSRQTTPPTVFLKPRLAGSPDAFVDFLLAEALVQIGLDVPEQFLGFFGETYPEFAAATKPLLNSSETYQLAVACYEAYLGLQTRDVFSTWDGPLFDAWLDAGDRLENRLDGLSTAVSQGRTSFSEAAELACSALKHGGEIPAPFGALDTSVYVDQGPEYAILWAERTVEALY